jgi:hypothetical protein
MTTPIRVSVLTFSRIASSRAWLRASSWLAVAGLPFTVTLAPFAKPAAAPLPEPLTVVTVGAAGPASGAWNLTPDSRHSECHPIDAGAKRLAVLFGLAQLVNFPLLKGHL